MAHKLVPRRPQTRETRQQEQERAILINYNRSARTRLQTFSLVLSLTLAVRLTPNPFIVAVVRPQTDCGRVRLILSHRGGLFALVCVQLGGPKQRHLGRNGQRRQLDAGI